MRINKMKIDCMPYLLLSWFCLRHMFADVSLCFALQATSTESDCTLGINGSRRACPNPAAMNTSKKACS